MNGMRKQNNKTKIITNEKCIYVLKRYNFLRRVDVNALHRLFVIFTMWSLSKHFE